MSGRSNLSWRLQPLERLWRRNALLLAAAYLNPTQPPSASGTAQPGPEPQPLKSVVDTQWAGTMKLSDRTDQQLDVTDEKGTLKFHAGHLEVDVIMGTGNARATRWNCGASQDQNAVSVSCDGMGPLLPFTYRLQRATWPDVRETGVLDVRRWSQQRCCCEGIARYR